MEQIVNHINFMAAMGIYCGNSSLHVAGLEMCARDARYSQLRSSACAVAKVIIQERERLHLSESDLLSLKNTIHERVKQDPTLSRN